MLAAQVISPWLEVAGWAYSASGKGRGKAVHASPRYQTPTLLLLAHRVDAQRPSSRRETPEPNPGTGFSVCERVKRPMMMISGDPRRGFAFCTLPPFLGMAVLVNHRA